MTGTDTMSKQRSDSRASMVHLDSRSEWGLPSLVELWQFRELLWTLTSRDIMVRYKQTAIGITWVVIQPFVTMVVFTVIFGRLAKMPSEDLPYAVFTMTAILPWQFFSRALTQGSTSLVTMGGMLSKIYFPRLLAPLSGICSSLIDFGVAFLILIVVMLWYGVTPGLAVVTLPLFILLAILTAAGASLWMCGLNVEYRDVQHALPFLVQIWMYMTPVVYPASMVPEQYRALYMLNPMAGVVEGFRWALLGQEYPLNAGDLLISTMVILLLTVSGLVYFNKVERNFVDRL